MCSKHISNFKWFAVNGKSLIMNQSAKQNYNCIIIIYVLILNSLKYMGYFIIISFFKKEINYFKKWNVQWNAVAINTHLQSNKNFPYSYTVNFLKNIGIALLQTLRNPWIAEKNLKLWIVRDWQLIIIRKIDNICHKHVFINIVY